MGRPAEQGAEPQFREGLARGLDSCRAAARFRRRARYALRGTGLSLVCWRALEATCRLVRERGDACSHRDVADDLVLDESSVGRTMRMLSVRGLVDHGIDNIGLTFRVIPTDKGARLDAIVSAKVARLVT